MSLRMEPVSSEASKPHDEQTSNDAGWSQTVFLLAKVGGFGWLVAGAIVLGTASGYWLDRLFGTTPALLIAGAVVGTLTAFAGLIRIVAFVGKERSRNDELKYENSKEDEQNGESA